MKNCFIYLFVLLMTCTIGTKNTYAQTINDRILLEYYQAQRYVEAAAYLKKTYQEPITDQVALRNLAYTSQMAGKLVDAENYYQRLFDQDTTKLSVLNSLAGVNLRRGNIAKAGAYYTRIIATDSLNFYVLKQLAEISSQRGDTTLFVKYLVKANTINPDDADVASDLSNWYVSVKKYKEAEVVLNKATTADPENVVLLQSLIKLLHAQLNWPETIKVGLKLQQLGDGSYSTLIKLGQAYYRLKNYMCCLETLAGMDYNQQNETSYYYIGLSYKSLKNYSKSLEYFEKAISDGISPAVSTYYAEIAGSYQQTGKFQKSALAYQKGLTFKEQPLLLYSLALLYDTDLKDKAKAIKYYKMYLSINPPALQQVYVDYTKTRITALGSKL